MELITSTPKGFKVQVMEESPITKHERPRFRDLVKSKKHYLIPIALITGTGVLIGSAISVSAAFAGIPISPISAMVPTPEISHVRQFVPQNAETQAVMQMLDPYSKADAFKGENSGRILLDILVIGCFGGIISAVLSASGQKNIAMLIGFIATMIIILKVVDLVNKVIDGIAKFLGM